ncbi:hypothetical protein ACFE04_029775 [Oxalis oulophora]
MAIDCLVLGAGQEVGKSCVVVTINGKRIMFDCGMHMDHTDLRRYPDFSLISATGDYNSALDCVVITHFHSDHIGALAYFTEVCGYDGPVYMTYPTKALAPLMLEDNRKIMSERSNDAEHFTKEHIASCMKKVIPVDLKQTVQVDEDLQIRGYYAGHVLGAAMFYAKVGDNAIVYTGDYNMTPDRHLGAAQIDRLQLDLVITESTYATTIRDSKYSKEREFLKAVHQCVAGGGKVLIPTFALGRAQELCMLLDDYWERMHIKVPIYFSAGLTLQANTYYKMLISWTSQKVKETYAKNNAFEFKNVQDFNRSMLNAPGPCVLFATPGMLIGGFSLQVFMQWAPSEMNLVVLPGMNFTMLINLRNRRYCTAGTIGRKLMSGKPTKIDLGQDIRVDVRCQAKNLEKAFHFHVGESIHQMSFSPHTDAKGIMDLLKFLMPKNVILVHGEKPKMVKLQERIHSELGIQCYHPANHETIRLQPIQHVKASASDKFIRSCTNPNFNFLKNSFENKSHMSINDTTGTKGILFMEKRKKAEALHHVKASGSDKFIRGCTNPNSEFSSNTLEDISKIGIEDETCLSWLQVTDERVAEAILLMEKNKKLKVFHQDELLLQLGEKKHEFQFTRCFPLCYDELDKADMADSNVIADNSALTRQLLPRIANKLSDVNIIDFGEHLQVESFRLSICVKEKCPYRLTDSIISKSKAVFCCCSWLVADEKLAWKIISSMEKYSKDELLLLTSS